MTKHPSQNVMNFRHLLSCDTMVLLKWEKSYSRIPPPLGELTANLDLDLDLVTGG